MSKLKNSGIGFLLAWQFFSAIPVKKQLDMNKKSVTWMYAFLPIIGLLMGALLSGGAYLLWSYSEISNGLIAILLVVGMIFLTGGLHLDGWIDMSDAFFSYGKKEKRLEILDDPRTGAFGVISIACLLLLKVGFVYEAFAKGQFESIPFIVFIPFLARVGMLIYFLTMPTSKQKGLAAYFKGVVLPKQLSAILCFLGIVAFAVWIYFELFHFFIFVLIMLCAVFMYRKWSMKHFGGMSGDLLGALGEGMEVLLWLAVLFFI